MVNPFHYPSMRPGLKVDVQGTRGPKDHAPGALPMRTADWPGLPGKTGPERNTTKVRKAKAHPVEKGL